MKTFHEQQYKTTAIVLIRFPGNRLYPPFDSIDEIKGLNAGHCLYRARWNWDNAESIQILHVYQQRTV